MEALNRASEILSKYASQGDLTQEDFDHYERMVISIIDGIDDEGLGADAIRNSLEKTTRWAAVSNNQMED